MLSVRDSWSLDLLDDDEIMSLGAILVEERSEILTLRQFAIIRQYYDDDTVIRWHKPYLLENSTGATLI